MARKIYGIGLNLGRGTKGFLSTVADKKLIIDDFTALLFTSPGERINNPDFGVGLERFLFEPNDAVITDIIRKAIISQASKYLPIVNIVSVNFLQNDNVLRIKVVFTIKDITAVGEVLTIQRDVQQS